MSAKVSYHDYLEAMDDHLSDALDSDDHTSEEIKAISDVRNALKPLLDSRSENQSIEAITALEAAAHRAFSMMADGDWLTE